MTGPASESPGRRLLGLWSRLAPLPGGRWLFSRVLGTMVPYTGTIGPRVVALEPGRCVVELRDRRKVRNHLRSVHAVALVNLGEVTTGLAMLSALPPTARGIVTGLEVRYHKKARGRLVATCETRVPEVIEAVTHPVGADIRDEDGDVVTSVTVRWLLSPR